MSVRAWADARCAGHPYQTTDSVEGTTIQADREVGAGKTAGRQARDLKNQAGLEKSHKNDGGRDSTGCVFVSMAEECAGSGFPMVLSKRGIRERERRREVGESIKNQAGLKKNPQEATGDGTQRDACVFQGQSVLSWVGAGVQGRMPAISVGCCWIGRLAGQYRRRCRYTPMSYSVPSSHIPT